jgi:hypothetical protein
LATRNFLSATTNPFINAGFCVATPVGQEFLLHSNACMQPSASIMPRVLDQASAPSEMAATHQKSPAIAMGCFLKAYMSEQVTGQHRSGDLR